MRELLECELLRDLAFCGSDLHEGATTKHAGEGAHDPTSSHYFVLDSLFYRLNLTEQSHILDVGCGAGRVLAYCARSGFPGRVSGVEMDTGLALRAREATAEFSQVEVIFDNVLNISLEEYTHFYLFNPFDSWVLERFVQKLECERASAAANRPVLLCHMSDNGENYFFMGRPGWRLREEGSFQKCGGAVVFDYPQHWSIWEYASPESN